MKESSLMRLSIKSAQFYAYHGVKLEEQNMGGKYEVDLDLLYDAREAIVNDDVNLAVNYEEAYFCIEEVLEGDSLNLIETIANEILNNVMERFENLETATVRIRKLSAPMHHVVGYVEAEQTVTRTKK